MALPPTAGRFFANQPAWLQYGLAAALEPSFPRPPRVALPRGPQVEMARRVEAGISDPVEWAQPTEAPPFDQSLVGKRIEVLWRYFEKGADKQHLIWSSGRVVRIADGLTDKRSAKARTVMPGGAVLWAWDADPEFEEVAGEQWLVLLPKKWNPKTQEQVYSWRYDPRELGAADGSSPDARRKNMRRVVEE